MQVTCPQCAKKMNVADSAAGKKVRCPGCKTVVPVPAGQIAIAPLPLPAAARAVTTAPPPPTAQAAVGKPASTMRCAACKAHALERLPANQFTRHPGYVCTACGITLRPPGSTGTYVFFIVLGYIVVLIGAIMCFAVMNAEHVSRRLISASVTMAGLGGVVVVWASKQLRLPVPLDASARPSRLLFWIVIFVVGLLLTGGALFFFAYFLHEM